ncbi:hypothetical protein DQ04_08991000 [Trypanosoma grayi]|uniref:hypothetical protein n=1 Tax=Trypanosoma grayi TaxID=71804 RepID=UPI0004F4750B|nr:hypothetical protein DQ04_08991000 [Trypanosoma grayi]KEG07719.1 hypothetical protein DQ04_08991000 [Trypanosoma grayi]
MSALPASSLSRLRVVHRSFLTRRGGRHVPRAAVAVEYRPAVQKRVGDGNYERVIDAEALHGDEQLFWGARRSFYRKPVQYYPTWDRVAQTLILMTRHVPRVPQEMAFRLMAVFLKLLLLPRLVVNAEVLLPSWVATNAEGLLLTSREGVEDGKQQQQKKDDAKETKDSSAHEPKKE